MILDLMKTKILLSIVVFLSVFLILFLFGSNTETWNSLCTYKREFGIFPYYREADNSIAGNVCGEAGVILSGVLKNNSSHHGCIFYRKI